MAFGRQK
ncbi:monothiol glutaredoxin, Grx4 family, partial [Yersinia pestis PY-11]